MLQEMWYLCSPRASTFKRWKGTETEENEQGSAQSELRRSPPTCHLPPLPPFNMEPSTKVHTRTLRPQCPKVSSIPDLPFPATLPWIFLFSFNFLQLAFIPGPLHRLLASALSEQRLAWDTSMTTVENVSMVSSAITLVFSVVCVWMGWRLRKKFERALKEWYEVERVKWEIEKQVSSARQTYTALRGVG